MRVPLAIAFSTAGRGRAGKACTFRKLALAAFAAIALAGIRLRSCECGKP